MNTTAQNNKLIAEFMGYAIIDSHGNHKEENYNYHSSWDWLMPVVEKIENLEIVQGLVIETTRIILKTYNDYKLEFWTNGYTKIEAVYNTVLEFIKWYNEQNK